MRAGAVSRLLPWAAFALVAMLGLALQLRGIAGGFLADDFSHLDFIYRVDGPSKMWSWTLARFYEPLGNGAFGYRPLAFLSYTLDWLAHGGDATGWRCTSLALFLLNAVAAGCLVANWLRDRTPNAKLAGAAAGCTMFAYPFAGEISFWLAGRFDLLACLFTLLFLLALPLDKPSTPRQHALRLIFLLGAFMSKESAIPLPFMGALLVLCCNAARAGKGARPIGHGIRAVMREMWPAMALFAAYLLWRTWLFGTPLKVYPSVATTHDIAELWQRMGGLATIASRNVGAWHVPWAVLAALLLLAALVACIRARRDIPRDCVALMLALSACIALYLVAPALSFPVSSPDGEGARHFYLAWAYASLLLGVLVAWRRWHWMIGAGFAALMLAGQAHSLAQWQAAGRQMNDVIAGVERVAETLRDDQYALLLLPDHMGVALFARAAQDAIVMPPSQRRDYLPRMAVMISADFPAWSRYITQGQVAELKGVPKFDPANFVGLFCWNPSRASFVPLTDGSTAGDPGQWEAAARRNFDGAGCLEPF
ncbi:MAG TPA: hypothetical protein PLW68_01890 [Casimicrobiaceae bacterium]|nr:hypothetical protein [Casimicrobiaceae bacterium]